MESIWLTVIEAAEYLKMGRSTVYRLAQEGKLLAHKVRWQGGQESGGRLVEEGQKVSNTETIYSQREWEMRRCRG